MKMLRTHYLDANDYVYESKNNGEHLVIKLGGGIVDYWPSSGKYHDRTTGHRGDDSNEFHMLIRARRDCDPVMVRGLHRPVEHSIKVYNKDSDELNARVAELEELLGQAWELINNEGAAWPDNFRERVMKALNQKPEAHNSGTKLPWEV